MLRVPFTVFVLIPNGVVPGRVTTPFSNAFFPLLVMTRIHFQPPNPPIQDRGRIVILQTLGKIIYTHGRFGFPASNETSPGYFAKGKGYRDQHLSTIALMMRVRVKKNILQIFSKIRKKAGIVLRWQFLVF